MGATRVGISGVGRHPAMPKNAVGPLISVILPVRNGMPWLDDQLRALADQQCEEPWEVVVADNGSTDGSAELAQTWADQVDGFRVVDASVVRGAPAARNVGVRAAKGDLLAFCDADDAVEKGWLAHCVAALEHADVVAGVFDFWSLNAGPESPPTPAATRQLGFLPAGLTANLAVRRIAFEDVCGFTEELRLGDDIDLCWRLQLRGFRFAIAPEAIVAKRERSTFSEVFRQTTAYGRCGPVLYRRYRAMGAHRDLVGAGKAWMWLALSVPSLLHDERRNQWARTAGVRLGRLVGSVKEGVFFP
jgi:glycosyltransferase involved in cell wall biosynthesis